MGHPFEFEIKVLLTLQRESSLFKILGLLHISLQLKDTTPGRKYHTIAVADSRNGPFLLQRERLDTQPWQHMLHGKVSKPH